MSLISLDKSIFGTDGKIDRNSMNSLVRHFGSSESITSSLNMWTTSNNSRIASPEVSV
jgi:hypothetical protein